MLCRQVVLHALLTLVNLAHRDKLTSLSRLQSHATRADVLHSGDIVVNDSILLEFRYHHQILFLNLLGSLLILQFPGVDEPKL